MADTDSYIKPQRLASQFPPNPTNPNKFYTHFMYKAVIVAVFLVVIPLLPSQAPEFVNQSLHTRSWELVQLLLVGIAVSYGLFSRRNDENQKENNSKFDNAHSYVSRFLQVSSIFEDEGDSPSGSDENKVQTWSSQYYRGEPVVVVDDDKPLVFPVRSLESRVSDLDDTETISESSGKGISRSRSSLGLGSGSKRFSSKSRNNGDFWGSGPLDLEEEEKGEENVVLRSPIPWRSRSGKMEVKEEIDGVPLYSLPPSMEESELTRREPRSFRSQTTQSSRPSSSPPPFRAFPKKPSPSSSAESQAKIAGEMARKKIYYQSSSPQAPPPPPPPPPPPLYVRKPPLTKSNSTPSNAEISSRKELNRSNSVTESRSGVSNDGSLIGKSVRTVRAGESVGWNAGEREERRQIEEKKVVVVETDEESESEGEVFEGGSEGEEVASNGAGDGGPDVDKKADEFIAKFREQIRLQRIDSIKRSTAQIARNSSR